MAETSYGVTSQGFIVKGFDTLVEELQDKATTYFSDSFPTTPDSVYGQFANIIADANKSIWDLGQQIANIANKDTATGIYLDYIADRVRLKRYTASGSTGKLLLTCLPSTSVSEGFICQDTLSRNVITNEAVAANRSSSYTAIFSISKATVGESYVIAVEGNSYSYTAVSGDTVENIASYLALLMEDNSDFTVDVSGTMPSSLANIKVGSGSWFITLTYRATSNFLSTTNSSNIILQGIGILVEATAEEEGDTDFPANSITNIFSSNIGVMTVTNPSDFDMGRDEETDAELRIRIGQQQESSGTATIPAMESALSNVTGVSTVATVVNNTLIDGYNRLGRKEVEFFVTGGSENDIGQAIWSTQPATLETVGDISVVVLDANGDEQTVYFSRSTTLYAWLRITYSINDEETFPTGGETTMKENVVAYGGTMQIGDDFEPSKFYAPLYEVGGVFIEGIEIATTLSEDSTPVYQPTRISIADTETLLFDESRVIITTA